MARSAFPTGCRVIAADAVCCAYRGDSAGTDSRSEAFWEADVLGVSLGRYALEGRLSMCDARSHVVSELHDWRINPNVMLSE